MGCRLSSMKDPVRLHRSCPVGCDVARSLLTPHISLYLSLPLSLSQPLSALLPFDPSVHGTARFIGHYIVVGTLSASIVALSTAPLNLASIHLAADIGRARYTDVLDVWRRVVSEVGVAMLTLALKCRRCLVFLSRRGLTHDAS